MKRRWWEIDFKNRLLSYLFTWYWDEISFPHKSFRNEFIPVFNHNEILVLVWHFILVSSNWKRTLFGDETAKRVVWGEWCMSIISSLVWRKNCSRENALGWASRFCHVNAVPTLFWNESHSRIKLILVSCEQPLSYYQCCLDSVKWRPF